MTATKVVYLAGRCANGAHLDSGTRYHALPVARDERIGNYPIFGKALCGAQPGRRSYGFSEAFEGQEVTCPRCIKKLEKAKPEPAEKTAPLKATFVKHTNAGDEYSVESLSNPAKPHEVHLSSFVNCDCGKFVYKLSASGVVSITDTEHHCQHISAALVVHAIRTLRTCIKCHKTGAEYECCEDWYGRNVIGFICDSCVQQKTGERMGVPEDTIDAFLASHAPTDAEKAEEQRYHQQQCAADDWADYKVSQHLTQIQDMDEEMEIEPPEWTQQETSGGWGRGWLYGVMN